MKKIIVFVLFFGFVLACDSPKKEQSEQSQPDSVTETPKTEGKFAEDVKISWTSDTKMQDEATPVSTLRLRIVQNGNAAEIQVGQASGTFEEIPANLFAENQIPKEALGACSAFWGGLKKIFYAQRTPEGQIKVSVGYEDESTEGVDFEEKESVLVRYSQVSKDLEKVVE